MSPKLFLLFSDRRAAGRRRQARTVEHWKRTLEGVRTPKETQLSGLLPGGRIVDAGFILCGGGPSFHRSCGNGNGD